ncbi:MAG TPA: sensor histidine kinase [Flavobacteriales bacterium]|nr:sensor histidine kinase [Flavobacteriales bacterium]HNK41185.1 sensor histidine kinase [Flavobacteriales bacterium]
MKRELSTYTTLVISIAVVWLAFAALIGWGIVSSTKRVNDLGEAALNRLIGDQRERMGLALQHIEQDLREEAAFVAAHDSLSDAILRIRWTPMLQSNWVLTAVALANEAGEEQWVERIGDNWRSGSTIDAQANAQPVIMEWPMTGSPDSARIHIGEPGPDPRRALWFGQALGEHTSGATWSTGSGPDGSMVLFASMIIRSNQEDRPYRVIRFTISPEVLVRSITESSQLYGMFHLDPEGRPWKLPDDQRSAVPISRAVDQWSKTLTESPFSFQLGDQRYMAAVQPNTINGIRLYTGGVVEMDPIRARSRGERIVLWSASVLLVVLGGLLAGAYRRGRQREQRAERRERQSITQERRLAKVISERETLDREVHHRVKNNLQVVSSLLHLQAERVADPGTRNEFTRGKRRIDSMALVHHKLYAQTDLRAIDLRLFMDQIANAVRAMHEPTSRGVSHAVDTGGITANADTAIQLGMILCELLSNAFLHAFPYITGGHIDIEVREAEDGMYRMTVRDNGKGIERQGQDNGAELGLELAEGLAEQIDGRLEITVNAGTRVDVYFRMQGEAPVHGVK